MKSLKESLQKLLVLEKLGQPGTRPSSRRELEDLIKRWVEQCNPGYGQEVDFNWIDISKIDDLSWLFDHAKYVPVIDKWNIDHVKDFAYMFQYCDCIEKSPLPVLQKNLLSKGCYLSMFSGCKRLQEAPVLPATKLTDSCYTAMFKCCTSLKVAPELPAKKLADFCYVSMFYGCTSLKNIPVLPVDHLCSHCYDNMFAYCPINKKNIPDDLKMVDQQFGFNMFDLQYYSNTKNTTSRKNSSSTNVLDILDILGQLDDNRGIGWISNSLSFGDVDDDIDDAVAQGEMTKDEATLLYNALARLGEENKVGLYINDGDDDGYTEKECWPDTGWLTASAAKSLIKKLSRNDDIHNLPGDDILKDVKKIRFFEDDGSGWYGYYYYTKKCNPEEVKFAELIYDKSI